MNIEIHELSINDHDTVSGGTGMDIVGAVAELCGAFEAESGASAAGPR